MPLGRSLRCWRQHHPHDRPKLLSTPSQADRRGLKAPRLGRVPATRRATVRLYAFAYGSSTIPILIHRVTAETTLLLPTVVPCRQTRLGHAAFLLQNDSSLPCTVSRSRWCQEVIR